MLHFCSKNSLLREMMTYQYFHSSYEHIDAMCIYATSTFLSCILDICRDRGIPHQTYPSTHYPWFHRNSPSCQYCVTKFSEKTQFRFFLDTLSLCIIV